MGVLLAIIAIILFGLIIFVHEFGHFFTAKLSGMLVHEFAIGMGPKIFSFKRGETVYSLRLFPIGGFCNIEGEDNNSDSENERSFAAKPVWKRMLVIVMGAILNIVFGTILMATIVFQQDLLPTSVIAQFEEGSKFEEAGLLVEDEIKSIDGYAIYSERDLSFALAIADPNDLDIVVMRNGELVEFYDLILNTQLIADQEIVAFDFYLYGTPMSFWGGVEKIFIDAFSIIRMVFATLEGLLTGQFGFNEVSGPVGMTQAITEVASIGLEESFLTALNNIVFIMAVISFNLGVFNLLPIPALDGGRFVFLLIEGIFKKPVPAKFETAVNTAGFVILIGFSIVIAFKDVFMLFQ